MRVKPGRRFASVLVAAGVATLLLSLSAAASTPGADVRLSNDAPTTSGYVSDYTLATGTPYTDATLTECSRSRGRENEPSVAVNPRNTQVIVGSSNDYCGVYNDGVDEFGAPIPSGPIWLGYYRSENGGTSFTSSLVPGYPDDTSPYAARAHVRTATAGDPVLAWDAEGRLFAGSESSDDPAGTKKTFGDVWVATFVNPQGPGGATINDGKEFARSVIVARGNVGSEPARQVPGQDGDRGRPVAEPLPQQRLLRQLAVRRQRRLQHLLLPVDRPRRHVLARHVADDERQRRAGPGDRGDRQRPRLRHLRRHPAPGQPHLRRDPLQQVDRLRGDVLPGPAAHDVQPVHLRRPVGRDTRAGAGRRRGQRRRGRDRRAGGHPPRLRRLHRSVRLRLHLPARRRRPAGDRRPVRRRLGRDDLRRVRADHPGHGDTDRNDVRHGRAGDRRPGRRLLHAAQRRHRRHDDAEADRPDRPQRRARATSSGRTCPPTAACCTSSGTTAATTRATRPTRPVGNCADRSVVPSLDVYASRSADGGATIAPSTRITDVSSNPNFEQFSGRTVPFLGDYIWVSSFGDTSFGAGPTTATPSAARPA